MALIGRNARPKPACLGSDRLLSSWLCAGLASYVALCWLLDISRTRRRLKTRSHVFQNQACQHQHRIKANEQNSHHRSRPRDSRRCHRRCICARPPHRRSRRASAVAARPAARRGAREPARRSRHSRHQAAADQARDLRSRRRLDQFPAARRAASRPRHGGRYRRGPDPQQRLRAGDDSRRHPDLSLRARQLRPRDLLQRHRASSRCRGGADRASASR